MIPAILAAPAVQSILGSVVGSVGGTISSLLGATSAAARTNASPASFAPLLSQLTARAHAATLNSPMGTMTSTDLDGLSETDLRSWMMGLTGRQVHAVDGQGHVISGIVEGYSQTGGTLGLNIGGHLVSIAGLSQISWSPALHTH